VQATLVKKFQGLARLLDGSHRLLFALGQMLKETAYFADAQFPRMTLAVKQVVPHPAACQVFV
jgi:hypothetical protein